jgi:3-dehydrosphinganine reductase
MKDLDGRHVVVTGGSYGLGKEIVRGFLREGANVYAIARDGDKLAAAVDELGADARAQRTVEGVRADVSDRESISSAVEAIATRAGGLDVLVNNAGIVIPGYFETLDVADFETVARTNYFGAVYATKAALPHLLKRTASAVTFTSSIVGHKGAFGYSTYSPTKAALIGLAEVVRSELKAKGVQVSVLCPPDTDTPGLAAEREIRPRETEALAGSAKLMSATDVAACFMRGFKAGKFMIICDTVGKLLYRLNGVSPRAVDFFMDATGARARKAHPEGT